MRVAIIGNMNNNGFSLLRYFRDLGIDAHLLLYANDGEGSLSHFIPENDTWYIEKWQPYIHQTPIVNSIFTGLPNTYELVKKMVFTYWFFKKIGPNNKYTMNRSEFIKSLKGYDKYIGSGIAPALFNNIGRRLDIFYPYSTGVEYLGALELTTSLPSKSKLVQFFIEKARSNQRIGILHSKDVINAEYGQTSKILRDIGCDFIPYTIPMVYLEEMHKPDQYSNKLKEVLDNIGKSPFFFSATRQYWVNDKEFSKTDWKIHSKNNDWLIKSFKKLKNVRPKSEILLVLVEYGKDVNASKDLCIQLGIEEDVIWVPKMARKELMVLTGKSRAVVGEFKEVDEMMWGGTGWEALACSKPLIHSYRFSENRFEEIYGIPEPPILKVTNENDTFNHLLIITDNPKNSKKIGYLSRKWFNEYNGVGMAKRWAYLLTNISQEAGVNILKYDL